MVSAINYEPRGGGGGGVPTRSLGGRVNVKPQGFANSKLGVTSPFTVRFRVNTRLCSRSGYGLHFPCI